MIKTINHVSFLVTDTERALEFYNEVLGLSVDVNRPDLGFPGAWLEVGEQRIHLLELTNPDPIDGRPEHGGRDRHAAFNISDFEDLVESLENNEIPYTRSRSGRKAIFCRDPDGNALEFIDSA
jgi:glyoxylase I family protein